LAVYQVTKEAVERIRAGGGPYFIESVTYRMGPHTTADDPTRYRSEDEVKHWEQKDPVRRFRLYLERKGLWDEAAEQQLQEAVKQEIDEAIKAAEAVPLPGPEALIEDVYARIPPFLREELDEILKHRRAAVQ